MLCGLEPTGGKAETVSMAVGESLSFCGPPEFPCEFGGYRLLGLLGRGGMGTVYEAQQLATGRRVALKMLAQQLDSPDMRQRFLREGRLAAGVSHPNSLYVFGTEEIEGLPVITMEIAASGTLKDRLKQRGPLPVVEAVDAILDVIAGLEAACAGGVLHRDVKPSNCFVSPDGSVKVGDFGLSVSTVPTAETFATGTGKIMGTPAYAPPEQLRGDTLDLRGDIYSVGATLFTLLTGRTPFERQNPVQIVAAALDEKPTSLTELRDDVPAELAQVVARCLAKKPEQRYADYATLRNALLPFSSERPEPTPLGRRALAGLIDYAICSIIPGSLIAIIFGITTDPQMWLRESTSFQALSWIGLTLFGVLYYTVLEGIWGAGLGKALMGFRVSRAGGRAPGMGRALVRISIGTLAGNLYNLVAVATMPAEELAWGSASLESIISIVCYLLGLSVFVTMRRGNGFATVWDLATGTRVVVKPTGAVRPAIDVETRPDVPAADAHSIGPYPIIEEIVPGQWIAASDPTLRRQVWLLRRQTLELAPSRRDLARAGRLRWLQSVETREATWDAFEALPGMPFSSLVDRERRLHWESLRHWLHDLALELALASRDETLSAELSLDHVWITARGRAILLDAFWPKTQTPAESIRVNDLAGRQRFLSAVADCADPTTIPLHARPALHSLAAGSFEKLSFLAENLCSLLTKPARLGRAGRFASLFGIPLFVIALIAFALLFSLRADLWRAAEWSVKYPDLPPLSNVIRYRGALVGYYEDHSFIDIHIVGHYAHLAESLNYPLSGTDLELSLRRQERDTLRKILNAPPEFTSEQLEQADRVLGEKLPEFVQTRPMIILGSSCSVLLVFIGVVQLLTLMLFRATPGQFLFGFAVVTAKGARAGRLRLLGRWLIAWAIFFVVAGRLMQAKAPFFPVLVLLVSWLIGLAVAVIRPKRGLHDQCTGCWLVPR